MKMEFPVIGHKPGLGLLDLTVINRGWGHKPGLGS